MKIRITKEIKIQGIVLKVGDVYDAKKTTSPTTHRSAYEVEKENNFILVFQSECEVVKGGTV